jgi:hypothetical protein
MCSVPQVATWACIWDSKTVEDEKRKDPTLAEAILSPVTETPNVRSLTNRINDLRAAPRGKDPAWWNDLAGAYLRLGQPAEAVNILEPLTNKFAGDYGIHANLGTAYHLLGRYKEAEQEIARDLEINPDAHFGLEKYHLALLQYLIREEDYRLFHVYVDEFTLPFLTEKGFSVRDTEEGVSSTPREKADEAGREIEVDRLKTTLRGSRTFTHDQLYELGNRLWKIAEMDTQPEYRSKWNLANDANLEKGVMYMASLNAREPACWVMLGLLAVKHSDKNLTIAAFEKAIEIGSPQAPILQAQIDGLRKHISDAQRQRSDFRGVLILGAGIVIVVGCLGIYVLRKILPKSH